MEYVLLPTQYMNYSIWKEWKEREKELLRKEMKDKLTTKKVK